MEKIDKLQQLKKLGRIFNSDKIVTTEDLSEVLSGIAGVIKSFKSQNEKLNADTEAVVEKLLSQVESEHERVMKEVTDTVEEAKAGVDKSILDAINTVTSLLQEARNAMPKDGADGKDADEEYIISEVLNRIQLPEPKEIELDTGEDIVEKINQLPTDEKYQIDASHIKNLPKFTGGNLGSTARNLWQLSDVTINEPTNGQALKYNSTTGQWENGTDSASPGGSDTQVQYNNAGSFGGITGATTNGTAVTYTTGNLIAHDVKASQSAGIDILSNAGTVTALFGAGGGANSTFYGGSKFDYATASTVPYFDSSKNLISSTVTPTELGYVSGVTSAIQTQLDGKQATLVSGTNIKTINGSSLLGSGDLSISATPAGSDMQVQFNDGGAFGAVSNFYFNKTFNNLYINSGTDYGILTPGSVSLENSLGYSLVRASTGNTSPVFSSTRGGGNASEFGIYMNNATPESVITSTRGSIASDYATGNIYTKSTNTGSTGWKYLLAMTSSAIPTAGSILFSDGTSVNQDNSSLFFDNTNNCLGLLTTAPTHTLTLASTSTGIAIYNTSDQTTNYERAIFSWTGNVFSLQASIGGTGVTRQLRWGNSSGTYFQSDSAANSGNPKASIVQTAATSTNFLNITNAAGFTASSGTQYGVQLAMTVNQTSTAGFTDLLVNRTQTAVGSGVQRLIDLQLGGATQFHVDNLANTVIGAAAAISTSATNGFLYIPTCAGAPSGVPTTKTGKCALVFDTTNNKLMVYDGGWIGVALA